MMKRTLLTLALGAAAGTAGAQTVTPPSVGPGSVTTPPVNPGTVTTPSVKVPDIANLPAANAEGSADARARIEADGYSNVQGLTRGPDGKWRGQATRSGARVGVTVDATGRVATE